MSDTWQPQYVIRGRVVPDPNRLYPTPGGMAEPAPATCRQGHDLGPQKVTVGWISCPAPNHSGHRTHTCRRCKAMGVEDRTIYTPPLDQNCRRQEGTRTFGGRVK